MPCFMLYAFFNGVGKGGYCGGPGMLLLEGVAVDGSSSLAALGLSGLVDGNKKLLPLVCCFYQELPEVFSCRATSASTTEAHSNSYL